MLNRFKTRGLIAAGSLLLCLCTAPAYGFMCSGTMYNDPSFTEKVTSFSPYEKVFLIVECSGLEPGPYTMHANWIHQQRGIIRSDKHNFEAEKGKKQGIFFWFKLSPKGPMASMFSGQDFHEENFGQWRVETYLNDDLVLSHEFSIRDD